MSLKSIAILPARGGSKRIPGKNIRDFNGQPMIAWPLQAARESGIFDIIHVSTDSSDVAAVAASLGAPPAFSRPDDLAGDMVPLRPVIRHVLSEYQNRGMTFDRAFVLFPCAPFLTATDLQRAADLYDANEGRHDLLSVAPYPVPVEWAYHLDPAGRLQPLQPAALSMRSQDIETSYYETGTFAVFNPARTLADAEGSSGNFIGFPIARECAIDIDTPEDWYLAERIHRAFIA